MIPLALAACLASAAQAAPAPKPVDPAIDALVSEHLRGIYTRFKELHAKRDKAVPVVIAKLESKDPAAIHRSLDLLLRLDVEGDGAVDRPDVIDAALRALEGRIACEDTKEEDDDDCGMMMDSALRLLERLGPRRASSRVHGALLGRLREREPRAAKVLGQVGNDSHFGDLEVFSHDEDPALAKASRLAMARLGHMGYIRETVDALKAAASRPWPKMREPFEDAAYVRHGVLVRPLAGWLYDCSPPPAEPEPKDKKPRDRVGYTPRCELAAKALAQIVDKPPVRSEHPLPQDIEAWRAWWEKKQASYP